MDRSNITLAIAVFAAILSIGLLVALRFEPPTASQTEIQLDNDAAPVTPESASSLLSIEAPGKGQSYRIGDTIHIEFSMSTYFTANLEGDVIDLYLVDQAGLVDGLIYRSTSAYNPQLFVDGRPTATTTITDVQWNSSSMTRNGGLDTYTATPTTGRYRILLVIWDRSGQPLIYDLDHMTSVKGDWIMVSNYPNPNYMTTMNGVVDFTESPYITLDYE